MIHTAMLLAALTIGAASNDLAGTVVDGTGKSIAQATVFIYTAKPRVGAGILCPSCYADCRKKATTDAEGKFLVADLGRDLLFRVLLSWFSDLL